MSDPLVLKKFSIRLIGEMFVRGVRYLKNNLYMSRKPILLLHGKKDKIVPYQFTENVYDSLITKDKTLKLYEDDFHEILNEYDKDVVLTDIKEWLDSHL